MLNPISEAEDDMELGTVDKDDNDTIKVTTQPQTLMVKAPKDTFAFMPPPAQANLDDPFARCLPDDADEAPDNEFPPLPDHHLPVTMPAPSYAPLVKMTENPVEEQTP